LCRCWSKTLLKVISQNHSSGSWPDLNRMYRLFGRVVSGLSEMKSAIYGNLKQVGMQINASAGGMPVIDGDGGEKSGGQSDPFRWVQELIAVKEKYDAILKRALEKDKSFQTSFNEALEFAINKNPKSPEYLSLFIDDCLKKGAKMVLYYQ
jgi:cullin 3